MTMLSPRYSVFVFFMCGLAFLIPVAAPAQSLPLTYSSNVSCITSNFNGTAISSGSFIWFNSVFKAQGVSGNSAVQLALSNASISFTNGDGTPYNIAVPDSVITLNPSVTQASISFNGADWVATTPPAQKLAGNIFLDGVSFQPPEKISGVQNALWCGVFSSDTAGVSVNWQWAAAVYTSFSTDNSSIGVKQVDDNKASAYQNSDHAGTPENFTDFVIGGARGGGGSNYTGSYSGTGNSGQMQNRGGGGGSSTT